MYARMTMFQPAVFAAPAADALFEQWLDARSSKKVDSLQRTSAIPYRYIWQSWCKWLDAKREQIDPFGYLRANGRDVADFLRSGPDPNSGRAPVSAVTRFRYGWLLREIYEFACIFGHLERNPVTSVDIGPTPSVLEQSGQILPPAVLPALRQRLKECNPSRRAPFQKRDKALMQVLLCTGLTSGELRNLTLADLVHHKPVNDQFELSIQGSRIAQARKVTTYGPAGPALLDWLKASTSLRAHGEPWVFHSKQHGQLTTPGLYRIVSGWVQDVCTEMELQVPNHLGPGTVRNTLIVQAMREGAPRWTDEHICEHFGVSDPTNLVRSLGRHLDTSDD